MSAPDGSYGQAGAGTNASEYNAQRFAWEMFAQKMQTIALVQVQAVSNNAEISPVGTVDVLPLVNQMTGNRVSVPHGTLYKLPYFRAQGGTNAVILDPKVGDIGLACFASRDISAVKSAKGQANPGSFRMFDWADGLYLGGFLNGTPEQYVVFADDGIKVVSPHKITLQAPEVDIIASTKVAVTSPHITQTGDLHVQGDITTDADLHVAGDAHVTGDADVGGTLHSTGDISTDGAVDATGDVTGEGTSLHTHEHSGVQSGGSNTGPPV